MEEDEAVLRQHALRSLLSVVETHWSEVVQGVSSIEAIYEDDTVPLETRQIAALLASKVRPIFFL